MEECGTDAQPNKLWTIQYSSSFMTVRRIYLRRARGFRTTVEGQA